jgi:hypothetical protein
MREELLVSVIIPTYKRRDKLTKCIDSVRKSTYKNIEIIVVNDDRTVDMSDYAKAHRVRLLQNTEHSFASYSRNAGARAANGSMLLFLDDDNVLDKDAIKTLLRTYVKRPGIGLLGPIMYNNKGEVWFCGARANWITQSPSRLKTKPKKNCLIQTDVIPNAYVVNKKLFEKSAGYDSKLFPIHNDDFDLSQKLIYMGYKNFIITSASTIHDCGSISEHISPTRLYFVVRSGILLEKKYAPKSRIPFFITFMPIHLLYFFGFYIPKQVHRMKYYEGYFRGLADAVRMLKYVKKTP